MDRHGSILLIGQPAGPDTRHCADVAARAGFGCRNTCALPDAVQYLRQPEASPELILVDVDRLVPDEMALVSSLRALAPLAKIALCHGPLSSRKARAGLDAGADWIWPAALVTQSLDRVLRTREYERPGPLPGATTEDRLSHGATPLERGQDAPAPVIAFGWHDEMLRLVHEVLEQAGCPCRLSGDPDSVPRTLAEQRFSLGVFDCWDGSRDRETRIIVACRRLAPSVPLLALLDTSRAEDVHRLLAAGADACLTKPFLNTELCDWVRLLSRADSEPEQASLLSREEVAALLGPTQQTLLGGGRAR